MASRLLGPLAIASVVLSGLGVLAVSPRADAHFITCTSSTSAGSFTRGSAQMTGNANCAPLPAPELMAIKVCLEHVGFGDVNCSTWRTATNTAHMSLTRTAACASGSVYRGHTWVQATHGNVTFLESRSAQFVCK